MRSAALTWPPQYSVRVSKKAKYARLRVLPHSGLEVVLPYRLPQKTAADIVEKHKAWICKTLSTVDIQDHTLQQHCPQSILLNGDTTTFSVFYGTCGRPETDTAVYIRARQEDTAAAVKELQEWVREYANKTLGARVFALAARHGMLYSDCRFRRQKSRWGSCTASGSLSLNTCLVFLPEALANHVILHELAHTRHMNHGEDFWKTLFAMEPQALTLDKQLRRAWRYVPGWIWL